MRGVTISLSSSFFSLSERSLPTSCLQAGAGRDRAQWWPGVEESRGQHVTVDRFDLSCMYAELSGLSYVRQAEVVGWLAGIGMVLGVPSRSRTES